MASSALESGLQKARARLRVIQATKQPPPRRGAHLLQPLLPAPARSAAGALCCLEQEPQPCPPAHLRSWRRLPAPPQTLPPLPPTAQPEWLKVISDTEADIGSNLRWSCAAAGKPRPTVRWLRNGEPLVSQVGHTASSAHLVP